MNAASLLPKQRGRPFAKGVSGNPKGRAPGARCKATIAAQALLDGEAQGLTRKAIEMALAGDTVALRICLERLIPIRRDRPLVVDLPRVASAADIPSVMGAIMEAVTTAQITPDEAAVLGSLIETHRRAIETVELEERLRVLEAQIDH